MKVLARLAARTDWKGKEDPSIQLDLCQHVSVAVTMWLEGHEWSREELHRLLSWGGHFEYIEPVTIHCKQCNTTHEILAMIN